MDLTEVGLVAMNLADLDMATMDRPDANLVALTSIIYKPQAKTQGSDILVSQIQSGQFYETGFPSRIRESNAIRSTEIH